MTAKENYLERAQRGREDAALYQQKARWFPWLRGGFFLAALVVIARVWAREVSAAWLWLALALFGAFLVAALRHQYLRRMREDAALLEQVNQRAIQRHDGDWLDFPEKGLSHIDPMHPYGHDLDLFGQGSLFQMINTTTTWFGHETLAGWLLHRGEPEALLQRQREVADLKDRLSLRQDIEREGLRIEASPQDADPESFLQWAEAPPALLPQRWLWIVALVLPLWVCTAMGYWMVQVLPPWIAGVHDLSAHIPYSAWWWFLPWLVLIGFFAGYTKICQANFRQVVFRERAFSLYRALFARIDAEPADGTPFSEIQARLRRSGAAPHMAMKQLQRIIDLVEIRQSPIAHLPFNLLLLWDIHCLFALERWKKQVSSDARRWFQELGTIEALSSLAGVAYDHPEYAFPTFVDVEKGGDTKASGDAEASDDAKASDDTKDDLLFDAKALGHPLLSSESRVLNDVCLSADKSLMLITGSNMSGKSTMLRAIGMNAVLAYAGGVVCASQLRLSMMQVGTSMRIADSLEHGVSYFMAELQRIHRIVSYKDGDAPLLFLLDEILHGTNTRERRIAAIGIISLLHEADAIGCVTTHDLELAEECERFGDRVQFTYFTDLIEGDEMRFDYELREGICPTTNALKLMRIVGIPLPEDLAGEVP